MLSSCSSPSEIRTSIPGSGLPIEPACTGSPARLPETWPVSVWP